MAYRVYRFEVQWLKGFIIFSSWQFIFICVWKIMKIQFYCTALPNHIYYVRLTHWFMTPQCVLHLHVKNLINYILWKRFFDHIYRHWYKFSIVCVYKDSFLQHMSRTPKFVFSNCVVHVDIKPINPLWGFFKLLTLNIIQLIEHNYMIFSFAYTDKTIVKKSNSISGY